MAILVILTTVTSHYRLISRTATPPRTTVNEDIAFSTKSRLCALQTAAGLDKNHAANVILLHSVVLITLAYISVEKKH